MARWWNAPSPHTTATAKPRRKASMCSRRRGYGDIAPIQIMDMGGEIEIPVAKYKHIPYDIVGMR